MLDAGRLSQYPVNKKMEIKNEMYRINVEPLTLQISLGSFVMKYKFVFFFGKSKVLLDFVRRYYIHQKN